MENIHYQLEPQLSAEEFQQVLQDSGLDQRRPAQDLARLDRMLRGSNLILTARDGASLVGIARSVTDSAYCCYLSDLAVSRRLQGRGIGRELIEQTRRTVGLEVSIILHAAPAAVAFYEKIGMPPMPDSFWYKRER